MIDVNVENLKNVINSLKSIIDEYEVIQLNLFNRLEESGVSWQDDNSINFDKAIYLEKRESKFFLQVLKDYLKIYRDIYNKYSAIGKKIKCHLESKNLILVEIKDCLEIVDAIIKELDNININLRSLEQDYIAIYRKNILTVKSSLLEIKRSITECFDKIENIEKSINAELKELDEIKINDFDFNLI